MGNEQELEQLRAEVEAQKKLIVELERTSKMLVRRDLELRKAYEDLKQLDVEKSEFVSIAAHQLRTPLTAVKFANQMLQDALADKLDESQLHMLAQAGTGINLMFKTIEDLLLVDVLDYGNFKLESLPISPETLTNEVFAELADIAKNKNLALITQFGENARPVMGDKRRLLDALSNIIDNAVKYTPANGSVTVQTVYDTEFVTITVADTGIGVPEASAMNLFKKFSRLENARRTDANGSGLGLYIAKKIIEAHHGKIVYEPNQPAGSRFIITLPI